MKGLTKRQREVLDYIEEYITANKFSPSYREIMAHFGFSSLGSVYKHINVLKRKGALMAQKNSARSIALSSDDLSSRGLELPFLGYIAAGLPIETFPQAETMLVPVHLVSKPQKSYVLQVRGDSMIEDGITDGDFIVVEARATAQPGETVVALINKQETTLKRFYPEADGELVRLEAANPNYDPIVVSRAQLTIQGVVRGLIRDYQPIAA